MESNIAVFSWFHGFANQTELIDLTIRFFAEPIGILAIIGIFWYLLDHHLHAHAVWELAVFFGIAFFATGIGYAIKEVFPTLRPHDYFEYLHPLVSLKSAAFPSLHTTFFAALGGSMAVLHPRSGGSIVALALLIGIARVAAGVHWPFDILGGLLLGSVFGWSAAKLMYRWMCSVLKVCVV